MKSGIAPGERELLDEWRTRVHFNFSFGAQMPTASESPLAFFIAKKNAQLRAEQSEGVHMLGCQETLHPHRILFTKIG